MSDPERDSQPPEDAPSNEPSNPEAPRSKSEPSEGEPPKSEPSESEPSESEPPKSEPPEPPPSKKAAPTPPRLPSTVLGFLAPFLASGWILGAVEASAVHVRGSRGWILLYASILASIASGAIGLLSWGGARAFRAIDKRRRGAEGSPPAAIDRARWIEGYGFALAALACAGASYLAEKIAMPLLFDLQEQELAKQLAVIAGAAAVMASLLGTLVLGRAIGWGLRILDRKVKIPAPIPGALLFFLFVTVPVYVGVYPLLHRYGAILGKGKDLGALGLVVVAGVQAWLLFRLLPARVETIARRVLAGVGIIAILGIGLGSKKRASVVASAESSFAASMGGRIARFLTDFDRDGVSSLFGGQDCAPFDKRRSPNRVEIPGNGIDEDCNGSDTVSAPRLGDQELFSNALRKDQIKKYNVVWVIMETVRADHVSAISYDRPTMPYLSKLAKESLLFTHAYSQSSATVLSVPSMLSGVDPAAATWVRKGNHPQLDDSETLLAERLKKKKYKTGFVLDTYLQNNFFSIHRGFDDLILAEPDSKKVNNRPRRNLISTAKAAEFLAKVKPDDNFFLTVYYPDQHSPYTRHKDVDSSKFEKSEIGDYDTELAFADQQIHALVEMLKARPSIWNNTILVINADHGEEFGEHGGVRHAVTCYNEVVHVPLLVHIPGIPAQRVDTRVALVDVVPTILELLGEADDTDRLAGQSLLMPVLTPERVDAHRPLFCSIASITSKLGTFFRRSVRDGKYTLIQDVNDGRFTLFDSENDLFEHEDLSGNADLAGQLAAMKGLLEASHTGNLADHTKMSRSAPAKAADNSHDDSSDEPE